MAEHLRHLHPAQSQTGIRNGIEVGLRLDPVIPEIIIITMAVHTAVLDDGVTVISSEIENDH